MTLTDATLLRSRSLDKMDRAVRTAADAMQLGIPVTVASPTLDHAADFMARVIACLQARGAIL